MYISNLVLKNFKCFKEVDLSFSKITLLTGQNSSGKSSLIAGLLSIIQSNNFPFQLSPNGSYVNLGDFNEIVFLNNIESEIGLDFSLFFEKMEAKYSTNWIIDKNNNMLKLKRCEVDYSDIKFTLDFDERKEGYYFNLFVDKAKKRITNSKDKLLDILTLQLTNALPNRAEEETKILNEFLKSFSDENEIRNLFIHKNEKIMDFLPEKNQGFAFRRISFTQEMLQDYRDKVNFISSFRLQPYRSYFQKSEIIEKIGITGENSIDQILDWKNTKNKCYLSLLKKLREMGLLQDLKVINLKGGRFEVKVKTIDHGVWASLPDVGYGISQFLPIIVADLQLSNESTLIVSQPEIHLHPSAQAQLGTYFVNEMKRNEKRYILETHSEYLINRLRLAIVRSEIKPEDVSLYYFENSNEGTIIHKIILTKNGQILNAPKGFFETYMLDIMNIAMSAN